VNSFYQGQEEMAHAGQFMRQGLSLHWFSTIDSTNVFALNQPGLADGTVIAADCQELGRGRLGRSWQSPPGQNLYLSLVIYPQLPRDKWGGFSLAAAVALANALAETGLQPGIKWPNDILYQGRKLAGILLESKDDRLVIGTGVNINQVEFPSDLVATSVRLATGTTWRRDMLLALLAGQLYRWAKLWDKEKFSQVISAWRECSIILGQRVTVLRGTDAIEGTAVDVDADGALIVSTDDGIRHSLHSGEVTLKK